MVVRFADLLRRRGPVLGMVLLFLAECTSQAQTSGSPLPFRITIDGVLLPPLPAVPVVPNASIHHIDGVLGIWTVENAKLHFVPVRKCKAVTEEHPL